MIEIDCFLRFKFSERLNIAKPCRAWLKMNGNKIRAKITRSEQGGKVKTVYEVLDVYNGKIIAVEADSLQELKRSVIKELNAI
ncbi:MAG: hypothetical protein ACI4L9_01440, partial [Candidatus Coproplasma sp.]